MSSTWTEVDVALSENRHEVVLTGAEVTERLSSGGFDTRLFTATQLNFLQISKTAMTFLPDTLGDLLNLTDLVLHSNKLESLPMTIGKLSKLKLLDVSYNSLKCLPEEISELTQLATLNVSHNCLPALPLLDGNSNLANLDASHNQLTVFPQVCSENLVHVSEIKLSSNKIVEVPAEVGVLPSLKLFHMDDNKLKAVPGELADCTKVKDIVLKGNPFTDRRLGKLVVNPKCHSKQIMDYIRQHCPRLAGDGGSKKKGKRGKGAGTTNADGDGIGRILDELKILHLCDPPVEVLASDAVKEFRPYIVCCVVRDVCLEEINFKKFISLQTRLHDTLCDKRTVATIATHDLSVLPPGPLKYDACPPQLINIQPLGKTKSVAATTLYTQLLREAENLRKEKKRNTFSGIHRYLHLLENQRMWTCLVDSSDRVISFPPITNSEVSKVSASTKHLLLEVTSSISLPRCKEIMDALLLEMLDVGLGGQRTLVVEQVKVTDMEGNLRVLYPSRADLATHDERVKVTRPT